MNSQTKFRQLEVTLNQTFKKAVQNLKSENNETVKTAIQTLVELGDRRAIPYLYKALSFVKSTIVQDLFSALDGFGVDIVPELLRAMRDANRALKVPAAFWLGQNKIERAIPGLIDILITPKNEAYFMAHCALIFMGNKAVPALVNLLHHPVPEVRIKIINCLVKIKDEPSIRALVTCLNDPTVEVRKVVLMNFWVERIDQGLPEIERLAESDPDEDVRFGAETLAEQIKTGEWVELFKERT